jgi:hypothetical protein
MSFKQQYTTSDLILSEASMKPEEISKDTILEKDKVVLSNDFYMLGQQLECLLNKLVK